MVFRKKLSDAVISKLLVAGSLQEFFTIVASHVGSRWDYIVHRLPSGAHALVFFSTKYAGKVIEDIFVALAQKEFKSEIVEIRMVSTGADRRVAKKIKKLMNNARVFLFTGDHWDQHWDIEGTDLSQAENQVPRRLWDKCLIE